MTPSLEMAKGVWLEQKVEDNIKLEPNIYLYKGRNQDWCYHVTEVKHNLPDKFVIPKLIKYLFFGHFFVHLGSVRNHELR